VRGINGREREAAANTTTALPETPTPIADADGFVFSLIMCAFHSF
jgi:hypothetical protein